MTEDTTRTGDEWETESVDEDELAAALNRLQQRGEIFAVLPVLRFGAKMMGTPVPNRVAFQIVVRRRKG